MQTVSTGGAEEIPGERGRDVAGLEVESSRHSGSCLPPPQVDSEVGHGDRELGHQSVCCSQQIHTKFASEEIPREEEFPLYERGSQGKKCCDINKALAMERCNG